MPSESPSVNPGFDSEGVVLSAGLVHTFVYLASKKFSETIEKIGFENIFDPINSTGSDIINVPRHHNKVYINSRPTENRHLLTFQPPERINSRYIKIKIRRK